MSREIDEVDFDLGIKFCNLQHAIRPQQREQIVKSQNYVDRKIVDDAADSRNFRSVTKEKRLSRDPPSVALKSRQNNATSAGNQSELRNNISTAILCFS